LLIVDIKVRLSWLTDIRDKMETFSDISGFVNQFVPLFISYLGIQSKPVFMDGPEQVKTI
jgi:hypothetical protein